MIKTNLGNLLVWPNIKNRASKFNWFRQKSVALVIVIALFSKHFGKKSMLKWIFIVKYEYQS